MTIGHLTEAEATKKRCFRDLSSECVASMCAAWRFLPKTHYRPTELWSKSKNCKVNSAYGDDAEWRPLHGEKDAEPPPAVGYCALLNPPDPRIY